VEIGVIMSKENEMSLEEMRQKIHNLGGDDSQSGGPSMEDMAKSLFGAAGIGGDSSEMIEKHANTMIEEFNGMLTQITFGMLLQMLPEDRQGEIRNQLYQSWRARINEGLAEAKANGTDTGLGSLFGVSDIIEKSSDVADKHIKGFLNINESN